MFPSIPTFDIDLILVLSRAVLSHPGALGKMISWCPYHPTKETVLRDMDHTIQKFISVLPNFLKGRVPDVWRMSKYMKIRGTVSMGAPLNVVPWAAAYFV